MTDKTKVKVICVHSRYVSDIDDDCVDVLYPVSEDWEEMTRKEINDLSRSIYYANIEVKGETGKTYVLIEYSENTKEEVYKLASDFHIAQEKRQIAAEKKKTDAKALRAIRMKSRKLEQLERLKKEFGE